MADAERAPGTPAPVSRLRGGPGTFGGCTYQVKVATHRLIDWLHIHSADPSAEGDFRCEPRVFPDTDHQFGFDYALTGCPSSPGEEYYEAKLNPSKGELIDLLASLRHLPEGERPLSVSMVSASANVWFMALKSLFGFSREATNDAELVQRVGTISNERERARVEKLLAAVGDDPWRHLQILSDPVWMEESAVEERATWMARMLAGSPAGGDRLLQVLGAKLTAGFTERAAYPLIGVVSELEGAELLGGTVVAGPPDNEDLAKIAVVLQVCPVPLPKILLAQGAGVTVPALDSMVAQMIEGGVLFETEGCLGRPDVKTASQRLAPSYAVDLARGVLEALNSWATKLNDGAYWQTLNAAALAHTYADAMPEVVAHTSKAFDKASKRWGDLGAVIKMAGASDRALQLLLDSQTVTGEQAHAWGAVRAQTLICGQSWVLQRVGQYDRALEVMRVAETISKENHDAENEAFALKCEGRLLRMQSETLPDNDPERMPLLQRSAALLVDAHAKFETLLKSNPRFAEDVGECVSLLARTHATAGDLTAAKQEAARAEQLLATRADSKAYADVKVLEADLFLFENDAGGAEARAGHVAAMQNLLERHKLGPDEVTNARASEVVARLHTTLARLLEATDTDVAVEQFEVAATIYGRLRYVPEQERNLLNARLAAGELVPAGLQAALNLANASAGARLRAIDEHKRLSTATPQSMKTAEEATECPVGDPLWDRIVNEAVASHTAATPLWTDGQPA